MIGTLSTAVGLLPCLHALTHHTHQFSVQTAVHTKRNAAEDTSEDEQAETPDISDSSRHLLGEVLGLTPAHRTHQPTARKEP